MPVSKLKELLDSQNIKYVLISHSPAFTAQEIAASAHIPGKELAKTVMVKIDGIIKMIVLPGSYKINFDLLKQATGAKNIELAAEEEFEKLFPECELGAMPPFGELYGLEVIVEKKLSQDINIAFNAGSHRELIKMAYIDFEKLVKPKIMEISSI